VLRLVEELLVLSIYITTQLIHLFFRTFNTRNQKVGIMSMFPFLSKKLKREESVCFLYCTRLLYFVTLYVSFISQGSRRPWGTEGTAACLLVFFCAEEGNFLEDRTRAQSFLLVFLLQRIRIGSTGAALLH